MVSVAKATFNPRWGLLGGLLICVDYFLTSAISSVSGIAYVGSLVPYVDEHKVLIAVAALVLLAAINIIGIRESALISLAMAVAALVINMLVIAVVLLASDWDQVVGALRPRSPETGAPLVLTTRHALIGFAGAWLAFSGLESISQLSPAMKLPIRLTASRGMRYVVLTVLATSPLLTLLSVALLPTAVARPATRSASSPSWRASSAAGRSSCRSSPRPRTLLFAANTHHRQLHVFGAGH